MEMKRSIYSRLVSLGALLFCLHLPAFLLAQEYQQWEPGQLFVKVQEGAAVDLTFDRSGEDEAPAEVLGLVNQFRIASIQHAFQLPDPVLEKVYLVRFDAQASAQRLLEGFRALPFIEYAEQVPQYELFHTPNDLGSQQWNLRKIMAEDAWDVTLGSGNVVVAIVDDAVLTTHQDLAPVIWTNPGEVAGNGIDDDGNGYVDDLHGWDAADNDNDPNPPSSATNSNFTHGTHCAGIVGAASNNNTGIASIGYGIKLMPVKSKLSNSSGGGIHAAYAGVQYAIAAGADVISMSWGGGSRSQTYQALFNTAHNAGIVLVAAAGNSNTSVPMYPASYNHVISVGATDNQDKRASFSNYGSTIDVMAPGVGIYSTLAGSNSSYGNLSGTSMACPLVSGLVGLMLSRDPLLSPAVVESCLEGSADNIAAQNPSYPNQLGAGRINAFNALGCLKPLHARFSASSENICPTQSVFFTDESTNNPISWQWYFPGGIPSSSTAQNPVVNYPNGGTYAVTLIVTNSQGTDTLERSAFIQVKEPEAVISGSASIIKGSTANMKVSFSGEAPWSFTYTDGNQNFAVSNVMSSPYWITTVPADTVTYTLVSVTDANCTGSITGSATINVVEAGGPSQCVVLQPGPNGGKDALLRDEDPMRNFGGYSDLAAWAWTVSRARVNARGLLEFNLSAIPSTAIIDSARLSLYHSSSFNAGQAGDNVADLLRVTQAWDESTVTWSNQPTTTTSNVVVLPKSSAPAQDYVNINVTSPVQYWHSNPSQNYGWMLKLQTEQTYRSLKFTSSDGSISSDWPKLEVCYTQNLAPPPDCSHLTADFNVQTACVSDTTIFADASFSSASSPVFWRWAFGDGDSAVGSQNPQHIYQSPGTYTVQLLVKDSSNPVCADTVTKNVVVDNNLKLELPNSDTICVGDSTMLAGLKVSCGVPPYTYSWSHSSTLDDPTAKMPVASPTSTTTYVVTVVAADNSTATESITIVVNQSCCQSHAAFQVQDQTLCKGETASFINSSSAKSGATYLWTFGPYAQPASFTGATPPSVEYSQQGVHQARLVVIDQCGADTAMAPVYQLPAPVAVAGNDTGVCENDTLRLGTVPIAGYSYVWSPAQVLSNPNVGDPLFTATSTTTFIVEVEDEFTGCKATDTVTVQVQPAPIVNLGADTILCSGNSLALSASWTGASYTWSTGSSSPSISVNSAGSYWVDVEVGCGTFSDTVHIQTQQAPTRTFPEDTTICVGAQVVLTPDSGATSYLWHNGSTSSHMVARDGGMYWVHASNSCGTVEDSFELSVNKPVHFTLGPDVEACDGDTILLEAPDGPYSLNWQDGATTSEYFVTEEGTFLLSVTNDCGTTQDEVEVSFQDCPPDPEDTIYKFWIPNAFSPNGDDVNDVLEIGGNTDQLKNFRVRIFNRWGQLLYITYDPEFQWGGLYNGEKCPSSTYVFVLDAVEVDVETSQQEQIKLNQLIHLTR